MLGHSYDANAAHGIRWQVTLELTSTLTIVTKVCLMTTF